MADVGDTIVGFPFGFMYMRPVVTNPRFPPHTDTFCTGQA